MSTLRERMSTLSEQNNSVKRDRSRERIVTTEINFDVKKSKPIIDEIDKVLAKHYGFTEEELDFIINYHIKYRMGGELEGKMSSQLIDNVIQELDFTRGELFDASICPNERNTNDWLDKGDWLKSAALARAEKLFFIRNDPMVVFASCGNSTFERINAYNKLWCLSRPRILFLESSDEIFIIDLASPPIARSNNDLDQEFEKMLLLRAAKDNLQILQEFNRENIESGKIFEKERFGSLKNRADHALIADLKIVRKNLIDKGLDKSYTHNLIGRSIFIRYLEDRRIIGDDYFVKIAKSDPRWEILLQKPAPEENADFSDIQSKYIRVLQSKDFTYALFESLGEDFNGDMFPNIETEKKEVKDEHLNLLRSMLYSNTDQKLFFYSYNFSIIPLDLISAIYEEFYQSASKSETKIKGKNSLSRQEGAFYTPPILAEFVISRVLTNEAIAKEPRILDPSCGSGIFLVEAFRRIVRYQLAKGNRPSFMDLKDIIGKQLIGIEINEDAARIAAFSLYIALLNYLDPPSILEYIKQGERLPNLIVSHQKAMDRYNNLFVGNAFNLDIKMIGKINIVVGNPPWGGKQEQPMFDWCKEREYEIGDKEPSQAFLLYAMEILSDNGYCAMLTSKGTLLNGNKSLLFRKQLLKNVCLTEVFNFAHIRKYFFNGAIAPFLFICFEKQAQNKKPVEYWSPKRIKSIENTQSILLSKYDRAYLVDQDLTDVRTWKVNWFGRNMDAVFISELNQKKKLNSIADTVSTGRGYDVRKTKKNDFPGAKLSSLKISSFSKYGTLQFEEAPQKTDRYGNLAAYRGKRLLLKRGISSNADNCIIARFDSRDFCFSDSIYGIKLLNDDENHYLIILGILWSSFCKYYFFNISSQWGSWHDTLYLDEEILMFPIPEDFSGEFACKVIDLVKKLRDFSLTTQNLMYQEVTFEEKIKKQRKKWEQELDNAVFDLYDFTEYQRDLIRDCCNVTLPFLYDSYKSIGVRRLFENGSLEWIQAYAERFAKRWQPYMQMDEVLRADVCISGSENTLAVEFYPADGGDGWELSPKQHLWQHILDEVEKVSTKKYGISQIFLDSVVHIVTNDSIIIIKRNEKRFWTKSIASEDAETVLTRRMLNNSIFTGGGK
jgi:type I restriction-modification system DNA methylase subunit